MATQECYPDEECYNVYWKIKNLSFCYNTITSPHFRFSNQLFFFELTPNSMDVKCRIRRYYTKAFNLTSQISFLTCDGSAEESVSGQAGVELQVLKNVIFGNRRMSFLPEDTLTVRFRSLTEFERGKMIICSEIKVNHNYFLWNLKDFSKSSCIKEKIIEETKPYGRIKLTHKYLLGIASDDLFSIEISRDNTIETLCCVLKVSIIDVYGRALSKVSDEFIFDFGCSTRGFPSIIKKNKLNEFKNMLLSDDTLTLKCYFAVSTGLLDDINSVISNCENSSFLLKEYCDISMTCGKTNYFGHHTDLTADLKNVFESGTLFDVSLKIGSELIQVHKIILSARSPVFKAMFKNEMKESINSIVVIEDLDMEAMHGLLLYIYTDTIEDGQWEKIKKLHFAADKYGVLSLKKKCSYFLKTNLSLSNVCDTLVVADLHHDDDLMAAVIDYISENYSAVVTLEVWKELETNNFSLAFKCMREIFSNIKMRLS